jgi:hypothetical protein
VLDTPLSPTLSRVRMAAASPSACGGATGFSAPPLSLADEYWYGLDSVRRCSDFDPHAGRDSVRSAVRSESSLLWVDIFFR